LFYIATHCCFYISISLFYDMLVASAVCLLIILIIIVRCKITESYVVTRIASEADNISERQTSLATRLMGSLTIS